MQENKNPNSQTASPVFPSLGGSANKKQIFTKPIGRSSIPAIDNAKVHTMQDDLDVANGVQAPQIPPKDKVNTEPKPNSFNNIFKVDNKIKPINYEQRKVEPQIKKAPEGMVVQKNVPSNLPVSPSVEKKPAPMKAVPMKPKNLGKQSAPKSTWIIVMAAVIVLLVFASGGYYFWITRQATSEEKQNNNEIAVTETTTTEIPPVVIEPQPEKFSTENPNYLRIDIANYDTEKVAALFSETAEKIIEEGIDQPVEFLVVDEDNNPVEFSVFSLLAGIKLPESIAGNLEDFSLYFYSDNGSMRMGMAVKIKEGKDITKAVTQEEKNLVADLNPLQLEKVQAPEGKVFSSSTHKEVAIRYMNLNEQITTSIDYAFVNGYLIIGTSKNTMRAILDKIILQEESSEEVQAPEEETTTTTTDAIISSDETEDTDANQDDSNNEEGVLTR